MIIDPNALYAVHVEPVDLILSTANDQYVWRVYDSTDHSILPVGFNRTASGEVSLIHPPFGKIYVQYAI